MKIVKSGVRYMQDGGAMAPADPAMAQGAAPAEQGGAEDQMAQLAQQLVEMLMQQIGDPNAVMAILQMAMEMIQQSAGGSPEAAQEPVFKKGGKLKCGGKIKKKVVAKAANGINVGSIAPARAIDTSAMDARSAQIAATQKAAAAQQALDAMNFGQAFAQQNKALGDNGVFTWRGKQYSTRRATFPFPKEDEETLLDSAPEVEFVMPEMPEVQGSIEMKAPGYEYPQVYPLPAAPPTTDGPLPRIPYDLSGVYDYWMSRTPQTGAANAAKKPRGKFGQYVRDAIALSKLR